MKHKILITTLFLGIFGISNAQTEGYYITNDTDGYSNVRRRPNSKAEIENKLKSGTLIYSYGNEPIEEGKKGDWHGITYLGEFDNTTDEATVFIHQSKLKKLEILPSLKKKIFDKNTIQFSNADKMVMITLQKFNSKNHKITEKKVSADGKEWTLIDGKYFLGSDHTPHIQTEYASIKVKIGNQILELPKSAFADVYNADNRVEVYQDASNKKLFIVSYNGDGAGSYNVCWEIADEKYSRRLITRGF